MVKDSLRTVSICRGGSLIVLREKAFLLSLLVVTVYGYTYCTICWLVLEINFEIELI